MGGFNNPVHRKEDPTPYAKITVNPIQSDKNKQEGSYTGLKNSTRSQIAASLVSYFKKILDSFKSKEHGTPISDLLDPLAHFQKLLQVLSLEDVSHVPAFTQELAEAWHGLTDNLPGRSRLDAKLLFFIQQVQNYPPGADHTLGYYLSEYAGKDWIPFPFMELLQILHTQAQETPSTSPLMHWLELLEEIV